MAKFVTENKLKIRSQYSGSAVPLAMFEWFKLAGNSNPLLYYCADELTGKTLVVGSGLNLYVLDMDHF